LDGDEDDAGRSVWGERWKGCHRPKGCMWSRAWDKGLECMVIHIISAPSATARCASSVLRDACTKKGWGLKRVRPLSGCHVNLAGSQAPVPDCIPSARIPGFVIVLLLHHPAGPLSHCGQHGRVNIITSSAPIFALVSSPRTTCSRLPEEAGTSD